MPGKPHFEPRLESLRGLAALIVAAHHGMTTFVVGPTNGPPLVLAEVVARLFWITNPASSVFFFFVLSGYVLGQSFERDPNYLAFGVRRFFRIVPPFVVSVLFAYACIAPILYPQELPDLTEFFRVTHPVLQPGDILSNLTFRNSKVNGPSWSIYPEIFGSISLPLLVYLHYRLPARLGFVIFAAASTVLAFSPVRIALWFYVGYFLPGLIARHLPDSWPARVALLVVGYLIIWWMGPNSNVNSIATIGPAAIGGSLMIAAIVSSETFATWLRILPLRFLGRTSYSFYLFHWPVFYLAAILGIYTAWFPRGFWGNTIICTGSIAVAITLSAVVYRWLEVPSIAAGSFLSKRAPRQRFRHPLPKTTD